MKKITIKGKEYVEVKERVIHFRQNFGTKEEMYGIKTEIVEWDKVNKEVIIRAYITDPNDRIVGSGLAHESQNDTNSFVNATSYVENGETSAIGRALASVGIGVEDAYASADEVQNAIKQQDAKKPKKTKKKDPSELMQTESSTDDSALYLTNYCNQLSTIFSESDEWLDRDTEDRNAFIANLEAEGEIDGNQVIYDFAVRNQENKDKLKNYAEINSPRWNKTLTREDGEKLIKFMKYLNDKFFSLDEYKENSTEGVI